MIQDSKKPIMYMIPKEGFEAERRIFLGGEPYPVYQRDDYYTLVAENGSFNFTKEGLPVWSNNGLMMPTLKR